MNTLFALLSFFILLGYATVVPSASSTCDHTKTASDASKKFSELVNTSVYSPFVSTTFVVTLTPVNGSLAMVQSETTAFLGTEGCIENGSCALSTVVLSEPFTVNLATTMSSSRTITLTTTVTKGTATSTTTIIPISEGNTSHGFSGSTSSSLTPNTDASAPSSIPHASQSAISVITTSLGSTNTTATEFTTRTNVTISSSMSQTLASAVSDNGTVAVPAHTSLCNVSLVSPIPPVSQVIPVPTNNNTWTFVTPITSTTTSSRHSSGAGAVKVPGVFCAMIHVLSFVHQAIADNLISSDESIFRKQAPNAVSDEDYDRKNLVDDIKKVFKNAFTLFIPVAATPLKLRDLSTGNGTFTPWWTSVRVSTVAQPGTITITSTTLSTTYAYLTASPTFNVTEYVTVNMSSDLTTTETQTSFILTSDASHSSSIEPASSSQPSDGGSSGIATSEASGGNSTWVGIAVGVAFLVSTLTLLYVAVM